MNKVSLVKTGPILLGFYTLSLFIFFLFSLIFPSPDVMKYFYLDNAVKWAFHYFIEFLIPVHTTTILLIYSLFIDTGRESFTKGSMIQQFVSSLLVLFMVLTVLYIICLLWVDPFLMSGIQKNEIKSRMARDYYELASEEMVKSGTVSGEIREKYLRDAFMYIKSSLDINPGYEEARELEKEIRATIMETGLHLTTKKEKEAEPDNRQNRNYITEADAEELLQKAEELYEAEKYFSAYYYASTAFRLDNRLLDAYTLSEMAMEKIKSFELSRKEELIKDLSYNKKDWYKKIASGEFLTVYYYFKELESLYPDDPDIKDYIQEIKEEFIDNFTFFYDEVKHINHIPGTYDILFVNYADDKKKEFISIHKMANVIEGIYFKDLEVLTVSATGEVLFHLKAPYGKYVFIDPSRISTMQGFQPTKHHINTYCIRAYDEEISPADYDYESDRLISPSYIVKPESREKELLSIIPLYTDIDLLENFQTSRTSFQTTGLLELFSLSLNKKYEKAGFNRTNINAEIISRFLLPFIFLFFSLISIAVGWSFRSRYQTRPPVLTLIFIPLFPVVITFLTRFTLLAQRVVFEFIEIITGLIPTLIICLVFQGIMIILALIIIAGKLTR